VKIGVIGRRAASKPSSPCQKVVTPTAWMSSCREARVIASRQAATASSSTVGSCSTPPSWVSVGS
jgi:hypothetical protein